MDIRKRFRGDNKETKFSKSYKEQEIVDANVLKGYITLKKIRFESKRFTLDWKRPRL